MTTTPTSTATSSHQSPDEAVVAAARRHAEVLAAEAARLEHGGVERDLLDRLAGDGLLAVAGPPELGGVGAAAQREVAELLAGASPDAWFVWFQHGPVVKMLAASENTALRERYLGGLCQGSTLGGVAWSNLRTPRPSVRATRVDGGWSLSGPQPWCTGWDLVDVVLVGGLVPATEQEPASVVFGIVPRGTPGLRSTGLLPLSAMGGTSTHGVLYEDLLLPDDAVVLHTDHAAFAAFDQARNANVQPSTFGIASAALDLLAERQPSVAAALRARVLDLRTRAYALIDEVPVPERVDERRDLRAQALLLALECCTALLAARGGQGMDLGEPAQRLLRAAAFQLVHSQDAGVREATLAALAA